MRNQNLVSGGFGKKIEDQTTAIDVRTDVTDTTKARLFTSVLNQQAWSLSKDATSKLALIDMRTDVTTAQRQQHMQDCALAGYYVNSRSSTFVDKERELQDPQFDFMTTEAKLIVIQNISKSVTSTKYEAVKRSTAAVTEHDFIVASNLSKRHEPTFPAEVDFWSVCEVEANLGVAQVSDGGEWLKSAALRYPPSLTSWCSLPIRHRNARLVHYRNMTVDHPVHHPVHYPVWVKARTVLTNAKQNASNEKKRSALTPGQASIMSYLPNCESTGAADAFDRGTTKRKISQSAPPHTSSKKVIFQGCLYHYLRWEPC